MVASELQPLARRGGSQRGWRRWGLAVVAVSAVAVAIGAVAHMGWDEQDLPVETLAWGKGKRLNSKEKAFVALATSTPHVDLHRATQFKDNEGSNVSTTSNLPNRHAETETYIQRVVGMQGEAFSVRTECRRWCGPCRCSLPPSAAPNS